MVVGRRSAQEVLGVEAGGGRGGREEDDCAGGERRLEGLAWRAARRSRVELSSEERDRVVENALAVVGRARHCGRSREGAARDASWTARRSSI